MYYAGTIPLLCIKCKSNAKFLILRAYQFLLNPCIVLLISIKDKRFIGSFSQHASIRFVQSTGIPVRSTEGLKGVLSLSFSIFARMSLVAKKKKLTHTQNYSQTIF